jgi:hypothetical protein
MGFFQENYERKSKEVFNMSYKKLSDNQKKQVKDEVHKTLSDLLNFTEQVFKIK